VEPDGAPLVLFDIDGTLVRRAGPHHRQALVDAVRKVAGLETTTEGVPVHGMLDPDILARMMSAAGASRASVRRWMPAVVAEAQRLYDCPDLRRKTCPGARRLLAKLHRRKIPLALVTGNLTAIGLRKLKAAGLSEYFWYGAFGEMARNREGLARLAIRHARRQGWIRKHARISLIGDAPSDVLAAKANGAQAIAVHTGISSATELRAHAPDHLIPDLRALNLETLGVRGGV
jgi:phosphoglycolate phosphatase-like HAD superfamily hydrolase